MMSLSILFRAWPIHKRVSDGPHELDHEEGDEPM